MASIKDLRKRIVSVKNTQQTTRAMKMVSAAKLRRAQEAISSHRPYARRVGELIRLVSSLSEAPVKSPLLRRDRSRDAQEEPRKVLLVLVTSDRGLCGGFNSSVIKATQRWIGNQKPGANTSVELRFVGRKGYEFFKNRNLKCGPSYTELSGKVVFAKAKKLVDLLIETYLSGQADEIKFVYNEFKNAAVQRVVVEDFLPLEGEDASERPEPAQDLVFLVKPSLEEVLEQLLSKNFAIQAFRILLESQAGEHGARMSAMENATKNAGEMIRKLTLQYNKQRQAGITKELLEIISGSESQKV